PTFAAAGLWTKFLPSNKPSSLPCHRCPSLPESTAASPRTPAESRAVMTDSGGQSLEEHQHLLSRDGAILPAGPPRTPPEPVADLSTSSPALSRPIWLQVLALAWPVLLQQFLILLVGLSDRLLAGRFEQSDQVAYQAAQTTAMYLSWFLTSYTVLVSIGSTALVARFIGAGDRDSANRATAQALLLAIFLGITGTVIGFLGLEHFI